MDFFALNRFEFINDVCVVCDTFVPVIVRLFCKIFWKLARILAAGVLFNTPCTLLTKTSVCVFESEHCFGEIRTGIIFAFTLRSLFFDSTSHGTSFSGFGGTLCPFRLQWVNRHSLVVYFQLQSTHSNNIPQLRSCTALSDTFANDLSHLEHFSFLAACTLRKCCRRYLRDLKNCVLQFWRTLYLHLGVGQKYCTSDCLSINFVIWTPWCFSRCIFKLLTLVNVDEQPVTVQGFRLFSNRFCSFRINLMIRFFSMVFDNNCFMSNAICLNHLQCFLLFNSDHFEMPNESEPKLLTVCYGENIIHRWT